MGRTVVIGAGASGLAAAYTLERGGAECVVLEKRDFPGGRIYGVVKDGFTLDLGAQFFFTRYKSTFELMEKLGILDQLVWYKKPLGILRDGNVHVINPDLKENLMHPSNVFKFRPLSHRGMRMGMKMGLRLLALGKKLDFDDPLKAIELDSISVAEYTRRNFGDEILEYVLQPVTSALTLGEPEDVSAAYGYGLLWYGTGGLGTLKKGIGYLADSLASNVSDIRLETEATRVVMEDRRVRGVEIKSGKKTDFLEADNVICTAIAPVAADLLEELPRRMTRTLSRIRYSSTVHAMFAVSGKPLGDMYGIATPRREGLSMPGVIDNSNKYSAYAPPGSSIIHTYTFGGFSQEMMDWDDDRIAEKFIQEIQMIVPQFPDEPLFREIFRWPEAAVGLCSPGQITSVQRLKTGLKEYRGLHLAGEYMGMPSVEAAIDSGIRAADRVLKG